MISDKRITIKSFIYLWYRQMFDMNVCTAVQYVTGLQTYSSKYSVQLYHIITHTLLAVVPSIVYLYCINSARIGFAAGCCFYRTYCIQYFRAYISNNLLSIEKQWIKYIGPCWRFKGTYDLSIVFQCFKFVSYFWKKPYVYFLNPKCHENHQEKIKSTFSLNVVILHSFFVIAHISRQLPTLRTTSSVKIETWNLHKSCKTC